ncbi:GSCOCG00007035001-RA-CDS [Cotesia congregata]|uniref:Alpha-tubulin N-acetyltransferase n=1 Tax=Cotesia congregata TaxID=51543 RepID=A0A8J2H7J9_COTCN|nr:GSCOCG00007035001-RA-CDS [Cotesia congregata]CAG5082437.1 Similar to AAEL008679: Alpha-tubulin N-acetyltransferase (Aedes aegypti) [Cotesia congregata]
MDFKFNVNRLLPRKINKVTHTLIPEDFRGDRREYNESQRQISRILDDMGEASAMAQGLSKPITSALKLRDTDHIVYLLVDSAGNEGLGSVVGLLKTGSKNLFMFDEAGAYFQLQPRCILDFYVHESKQRMGFGKDLYEFMLVEERIRPVKLAIDRPSDKFLRFLRRHYDLEEVIPQNNKFVVFRGFFDTENQEVGSTRYSLPSRGSVDYSYNNNNNNNSKPPSASSNGHSMNHSNSAHSGAPRSSYGRFAAARPPCSMANIIHNVPVFGHAAERTGDVPSTPGPKLERPRSLSLYSELEQKQRNHEMTTVPTPAAEPHCTPFVREVPIDHPPAPQRDRETYVPVRHHYESEQLEPPTPQTTPNRRLMSQRMTSDERSINHLSSNERPMTQGSSDEAPMNQTSNERPGTQSSSHESLPRERPMSHSGSNTRPISKSRSTDRSMTQSAAPSGRQTPQPKKNSTQNFMSIHSEEKSPAGIKTTPSCASEVNGNQNGHLDLKFYHSPLW